MLLLVTSQPRGLDWLLEQSNAVSQESMDGGELYALNWKGKRVLALTTGCGKTQIGWGLSQAFERKKIDALLGFGTAGSLGEVTKAPAVWICREAFQYDVDFVPLGAAEVALPRLDTGLFAADPEMVKRAKRAAMALFVPCDMGRIASADRFLADERQREQLRRRFFADAVDTSTGALAQIAFQRGLPYTALRVLCDDSGAHAAEQYRLCRETGGLLAQQLAASYLNQDI